MSVPIWTVDAFTPSPFSGNPAGVCLLAHEMDDAWMASVAREMNLAETAFLLPAGNAFSLRWFTPTTEVDLCGHATLASAHILWEQGVLAPSQTARFQTRSGELTAELRGNRIEMNFPAEPAERVEVPPGLEDALHMPVLWVGRNRMDLLVEVETEEIVLGLMPDIPPLAGMARGVIVTAASGDERHDFTSRCFYPAVGVPEDPVTGSAHCALGPFWAPRLGKDTLLGYQASPRGGEVTVTVQGDRVLLGGQAVTVIAGEIRVDS